MTHYEPLLDLIQADLDPTLNWRSRCHMLGGYLSHDPQAPVFIKREDELSATASGTKHRKYLSLLPALTRKGIQEVILIGSAYSNNVLGLTQLLRSRGYSVTALVKAPGADKLQGNYLMLKLLLDERQIRLVSSREWPRVEHLAKEIQAAQLDRGVATEVISEGGYNAEVLPGILTLAVDLLRNSDQLGVRFRDIWTDSGSGVSAIGLLLGLRLMGDGESRVHITQIAGTPREFARRYHRFENWLEARYGRVLPRARPRVHFLRPATAASYGSINAQVIQQTRRIARDTGLLMDPLYSVKHLYTIKQAMEQRPPESAQLILYNGGTLGLMGFQDRLASLPAIG